MPVAPSFLNPDGNEVDHELRWERRAIFAAEALLGAVAIAGFACGMFLYYAPLSPAMTAMSEARSMPPKEGVKNYMVDELTQTDWEGPLGKVLQKTIGVVYNHLLPNIAKQFLTQSDKRWEELENSKKIEFLGSFSKTAIGLAGTGRILAGMTGSSF